MSITSKNARGTPRLGALLRIIQQAMAEELAVWLASSAWSALQPGHSAAIHPLWQATDGARITSLARASRITKQSMSVLVDHLEAHGYVERMPDPDDARAVRVRLTAKGRELGAAVRAFSRRVEADWATRIGADRMDALLETLELLRQALASQTEALRETRTMKSSKTQKGSP